MGKVVGFNFLTITCVYYVGYLDYYLDASTYLFQLVGCVGALRLNKKLLRIYWTTLFCLLVGDILVGATWMFRFDAISRNIVTDLGSRLESEYASPASGFRAQFDDLQLEGQCCGVLGPLDYNKTWWYNVTDKYYEEENDTTTGF